MFKGEKIETFLLCVRNNSIWFHQILQTVNRVQAKQEITISSKNGSFRSPRLVFVTNHCFVTSELLLVLWLTLKVNNFLCFLLTSKKGGNLILLLCFMSHSEGSTADPSSSAGWNGVNDPSGYGIRSTYSRSRKTQAHSTAACSPLTCSQMSAAGTSKW